MTARRDFEVIGETLVKVRCGAHLSGVWHSGQTIGDDLGGRGKTLHLVNELGLTDGPIKISLIGHHEDMRADSFGPKAAPDVMYNYGEAKIDMTLIHYNPSLLELCYNESMGGMQTNLGLTPPGTPLGKGNLLYASGCNYLGLTLWPTTQARFETDYNDAGGFNLAYFQALLILLGLDPGAGPADYARTLIGSGAWTFFASYITMQPQEIPLSTKVSKVNVSWRGIAYAHQFSVLGPAGVGSPVDPTEQRPRLYSRTIPSEILDTNTEVFIP